jgi:hypothetical protein
MTRRFVLLSLVALGGCSSTEPSNGREIGIIQPGATDALVIEAPDTVAAGATFEAVINTFGSSCVTPAGVSLRTTPATATVTPFDLTPDGPCTRDFRARPHPVRLTLTRPGAGEIVVRGAAMNGTIPGRTLITVRKAIWVTP